MRPSTFPARNMSVPVVVNWLLVAFCRASETPSNTFGRQGLGHLEARPRNVWMVQLLECRVSQGRTRLASPWRGMCTLSYCRANDARGFPTAPVVNSHLFLLPRLCRRLTCRSLRRFFVGASGVEVAGHGQVWLWHVGGSSGSPWHLLRGVCLRSQHQSRSRTPVLGCGMSVVAPCGVGDFCAIAPGGRPPCIGLRLPI